MKESPGDRILVVEDSDDDFDTIMEAARRSGLRAKILRAVDGETALSALADQGSDAFRLVILDNNLPGLMSGYDLLVELRSRPALHHLPAVIFSTSSNQRDCVACYRAGANAYHVKDVGFNECLLKLHAIFDYWLTWTMTPVASGTLP